MARIVCVGIACLDYLFRVTDLPQGGGKFFAQDYAAALGGPAAVASLSVAALGHEARFFGRLGEDVIGRDIIRHLTARGVVADEVRLIPGQSSQVSSVVVDQKGERQVVNFSSAQLDPDPSWLPEAVIAEADFLLTDVRWPEGAAAALKMARKHRVPSLIDADIAPVDISELVQLATYAVFSERGLESVCGAMDLEDSLKNVAGQGDTIAAVTAGEKGSFWLEDGRIKHCPAEVIEAIDTCGAGDVFHGAFAVAMVEKMGMDAAMRFAAATAALKCLRFGGSTGVPDRSAVDQMLG